MSKIIYNSANYDCTMSRCFEHPQGVSMTVPDETYTVRELVDRFVRGQTLDDRMKRQEAFDSQADFDSPDLEELKRSDFVEQEEFSAAQREFVSSLRLKKKRERDDLFLDKDREPRQGAVDPPVSDRAGAVEDEAKRKQSKKAAPRSERKEGFDGARGRSEATEDKGVRGEE